MKKSLGALGLLAAAALALAGCTDSGASPSAAPTTEETPPAASSPRSASPRSPSPRPAPSGARSRRASSKTHGLEVEIVPAQGGAQAIPALLSGDIQFAIGQPFGPIRADLQDLGIVVIGNYASSLAEGKDVNAVVSLGGLRHHHAEGPRRQARLGQQPRRCR